MNPLPYKVVITGANSCMKAINWCTQHIKEENWKMEMYDLRPVYTFKFTTTQEANWFKLKWQ